MSKIIFLCAIFSLSFAISLPASNLQKQEIASVKIGILSYRPKKQTLQEWSVLKSIIEEEIQNIEIRIKAYNIDELTLAVKNQEIDLVLRDH